MSDREQAAFEEWALRVRPSGDVEAVQAQWLASYEYADLLLELETGEPHIDGWPLHSGLPPPKPAT